MAGKSNIEWTEHTWNPIVGCSIVSPGCTNCYAMRMARRIDLISIGSPLAGKSYGGLTKIVNGNPVWTGALRFVERALTVPLKRKKPTTYFVNSMGDLFHEDAPDEWIDKVFAVMALCPQHTFQVLTKRAERMRDYLSGETMLRLHRINGHTWSTLGTPFGSAIEHNGNWRVRALPLPNVWLGVSCERQQEADERIPLLLQTPAAVRFISAEPLLGPIDLRHIPFTSGDPRHKQDTLTGEALMYGTGVNGNPDITVRMQTPKLPRLNWIIVGGESGPDARPMEPQWARSIRDQCEQASVPFFFKQWGEWGMSGAKLVPISVRLGKKRAGRLLDGKEHNAMPLSDHQNAPTDDTTGQRSGLSP